MFKACHCCGLIHEIAALQSNERAQCTRCDSVIDQSRNFKRSQGRTAAAAVAAMVLLPAAVLLPILEIEQLGPAFIAFVLCVSMSMIAAICFDPHAIWESP